LVEADSVVSKEKKFSVILFIKMSLLRTICINWMNGISHGKLEYLCLSTYCHTAADKI